MKNLINEFIESIKKNRNNIAFLSNKKQIFYQQFEQDIYKVLSIYNQKAIKKHSRILLFINQSYLFYVYLIASLMYGMDIVVIDNFKDKTRVNKQINDVSLDYVLVNYKTTLVRNLFTSLKKIPVININAINKINKIEIFDTNSDGNLITFTSGGTSNPKPVIRTLNDLNSQIELSKDLINNNQQIKIVLSTLPIYTLLCLMIGKTVIIGSKKIKNQFKLKPDTLLSSIANIISTNIINNDIKYIYIGGTPLYYHEVHKLKSLYSNAEITYIYGATEASLIAKTTLDEYEKNINNNIICMGKINEHMDVSIKNNEIVINNGVLTNHYVNKFKYESNDSHLNDGYHTKDLYFGYHTKDLYFGYHTKDLGFINNNMIYLTGRIIKDDMKRIEADYLIELMIKRALPKLDKVAVLKSDDKIYIFIDNKDKKYLIKNNNILNSIVNYQICFIKDLPLDYRHHMKINYQKLIPYIN